ncbi:MAG TPA: lipopolysaccharide assembly protein LapB, partial [Cupriavidus sp.]|nr:lipopolysaccharide assembly protein LapB [Cupriavidus sp.]
GEQGKALEWLHGLLKGNLAPELLDTAYRTELEVNGPVAAAALMREQLRRQPTLLALTKYFEAQAAENQAAQEQSAESAEGGGDAVVAPQAQETAAIRDLLQLRTRNLARYTCRECGFRARLFYWQCPGCNRWETYAPRRSEALG